MLPVKICSRAIERPQYSTELKEQEELLFTIEMRLTRILCDFQI